MISNFDKLLDIVNTLRGENGCDWDKEQTFDTIKLHITEESYELIDAINNKDFNNIKEELGDLMLQILLISQIAKEDKLFAIDDVLNEINEKLIRRHPHVFGDTVLKGSKNVLKQWETIKKSEKEERKSILDGIPKSLPTMNTAYKLMEKAARVGFEYKNVADSFDKIREEFNEAEEAFNSNDKEHLEEELGDLMMTIIDFARMNNINPDSALSKTNKKFIRRFQYIENKANALNKTLESMTLEEMDSIWCECKRIEKNN